MHHNYFDATLFERYVGLSTCRMQGYGLLEINRTAGFQSNMMPIEQSKLNNFDNSEAAVRSGAHAIVRAAIEKTMPPASCPLPELTQAQIDVLIAWQAAVFPRTATATVTPPPLLPNQAPIANAGVTQDVNEGASVNMFSWSPTRRGTTCSTPASI